MPSFVSYEENVRAVIMTATPNNVFNVAFLSIIIDQFSMAKMILILII